jgi:hypothetical protein
VSSHRRRLLAVVAGALACVLVSPGTAAADPAGPTDYRTEIVAIDPATASIEPTMIGGDSFLELRVAAGTEVVVTGYRGEPYLRFDADGSVWENRRSPTRWQNDDRFGDVEIPPEATADAPPDWHRVADGGRYAWHDHRTHWMNEARPPGASAGEVILEAVVPLVVDGTPVAVTVRSVWLPGPSPLIPIVGAGLAVLVLGFGLRFAGPVATTGAAAVVAAVASGVLGGVAYRSVPPETGPSRLLWLLPASAVVALAAAAVAHRRRTIVASGLAVAGLLLGIWAWLRREAVLRAIIPSDAPAAVDRFTIAVAAVVGGAALIAALAHMATPHPPGITAPSRGPRRARRSPNRRRAPG